MTKIILPQNESLDESLKYYPLQVGNYWQYEASAIDEWGNDSVWYASREIVGDTLLTNGKKYFIFVEKGIKTLRSKFVRIDSSNGFIYSFKNEANENREDSLVLSYWDSLSCERVEEIYFEELFGHSFEIRPYLGCVISFGCDKNRKLAKNIGLIELHNYCFDVVATGQSYFLNFAKINNIEYGTLVTVKNNIHQAINSDYNISQNYPNPFNPTTNIVYHLSEKGFVDISVYDLLGHKIATLINGYKNEGSYKIKFDGSKLSSGIYYYVFSNNKSRISNKMLLIK